MCWNGFVDRSKRGGQFTFRMGEPDDLCLASQSNKDNSLTIYADRRGMAKKPIWMRSGRYT